MMSSCEVSSFRVLHGACLMNPTSLLSTMCRPVGDIRIGHQSSYYSYLSKLVELSWEPHPLH
ncbi:hypothetical protein Hanom_Chr10g00873891 [Helianthus anomalus]